MDQAVPSQHMNDLKYLLDCHSGCGNIPCGSGASTTARFSHLLVYADLGFALNDFNQIL